MITALYAVGPHGEFGLKGRLPWGSFKEELEVFKKELTRSYVDGIIVGIKTWEGLPNSVKELVKNKVVYLYAPKKNLTALVPYLSGQTKIRIIHKFDVSLIQWSKDNNLLVIGGAQTLKDAMDAGILDGAFISRVEPKDHVVMENDSTLALDLWNEEYTPEATVFIQAYGENETHTFVQEYHFFGTV